MPPRSAREGAGVLIHIDVKRLGRVFAPGKRILNDGIPEAQGLAGTTCMWRSTITRAWTGEAITWEAPSGIHYEWTLGGERKHLPAEVAQGHDDIEASDWRPGWPAEAEQAAA